MQFAADIAHTYTHTSLERVYAFTAQHPKIAPTNQRDAFRRHRKATDNLSISEEDKTSERENRTETRVIKQGQTEARGQIPHISKSWPQINLMRTSNTN